MSPPPSLGLFVRDLDDRRIDQAYPLIKTALPDLTLEDWRRFLDDHLRQDASGVVVVENRTGIMYACAAFQARQDLRHGRCLEVDPLVVMDLVGAATVARTLDFSLLGFARRFGCQGLRIQVPRIGGLGAEDPAVSAFLRCGLAADGLGLSKKVAVGRPSA